MPRGKRKEDTVEVSKMKDAFINCKMYTQDQVRNALAEICNREDVDIETARRISEVLDNVVSDSFSKVMASTGM